MSNNYQCSLKVILQTLVCPIGHSTGSIQLSLEDLIYENDTQIFPPLHCLCGNKFASSRVTEQLRVLDYLGIHVPLKLQICQQIFTDLSLRILFFWKSHLKDKPIT